MTRTHSNLARDYFSHSPLQLVTMFGPVEHCKNMCNFWIISLKINLLSQCIPLSLILGQEQQLKQILDLKMEATCWRWYSQLTSQTSMWPHTYHKREISFYIIKSLDFEGFFFFCHKSLSHTLIKNMISPRCIAIRKHMCHCLSGWVGDYEDTNTTGWKANSLCYGLVEYLVKL